MKRYLIPLLLLSIGTTAIHAQSKCSPALRSTIAQQRLSRSNAEAQVSAFIGLTPDQKADNTATIKALTAMGVQIGSNLGDILTATIPLSALEAIADLDGVRYIEVGETIRPMSNTAREATHMNTVTSADFTDHHGYTGRGVVVGVVDKGFNYQHPAFYNDDRSALRIKRAWEQESKPTPDFGTYPEGFSYGIDLCTPETIYKACRDASTTTHGTHVANVAAGGDRGSVNGGQFHGMAPEADLVMVSYRPLDANNINIADGVKYIFDYADSQQQPAVVNLSLGACLGPHDGTSLFDQACDRMADASHPGHIIVGSSGNYAMENFHISRTFTTTDVSTPTPLRAMVDFTMGSRYAAIDVWGQEGCDYTVGMAIVDAKTGEVVETSDVINTTEAFSDKATYSTYNAAAGYAIGNTLFAGELNPYNNKKHVRLTTQLQTLKSGYALALIVTPLTEGRVDTWIDAFNSAFLSSHTLPAGYTPATNACTLLEIGGTGKNILSVGAYSTRDTFYDYTYKSNFPSEYKAGTYAAFTSHGLTPDGRFKPEVCAPGAYIASAINAYYNTQAMATAPYACAGEKIQSTTYNYGYMSGTSQAAPVVAGIIATWLEANPSLTIDDVRDIIAATAVADQHTGAVPNHQWGYGKIDGLAGICHILGLNADDFTGIATLTPTADTDAPLYDAMGRRVSQPQHGHLYLQSGRKFIAQ